jgi:hypothetical protein
MRLAICPALLAAAMACGSAGGPTASEASPAPAATGTPAATADLCAGLAADKAPHPFTALGRPALRVPVTDPDFGARIIRITDAKASAGDNAVIKPMYSTTQAWNADESLLVLWNRARGHELYDGRSYAFVRGLPLESPTDLEQLYWDPLDPDVLYYPSNFQAQPRLMRYRVSRNASDLVRDFGSAPTRCPVSWDALLTTGSDPLDMSWGSERVIGLRCGRTKFVYSIAQDKVLGILSDAGDTTPGVSPDGALAYYQGRVYDAALNSLRTLALANPDEHSCLGRGADGPLFGAVDFDGTPPGSLIAHDMRTGAKHPVVSTATGWPYPPTGTHVSGLARSGPPGWFALSVVGDPAKNCVLCQELLLANADTGAVCRVARHRSWAGEGRWGYWAEPHVGLSPTGTRLLFGSDWGNGLTVDTYVVELPAYAGRSSSR